MLQIRVAPHAAVSPEGTRRSSHHITALCCCFRYSDHNWHGHEQAQHVVKVQPFRRRRNASDSNASVMISPMSSKSSQVNGRPRPSIFRPMTVSFFPLYVVVYTTKSCTSTFVSVTDSRPLLKSTAGAALALSLLSGALKGPGAHIHSYLLGMYIGFVVLWLADCSVLRLVPLGHRRCG